MRIFTFYITWELVKVFTISLFAITLVMVLFGVGRQAVEMNLGLGPVLRIIPFVLPNSLAFAIPGTVLYTVCTVYGGMSADNEVVALKSLGVPPKTVIWPAWGMAFILSLVCVWMNDLAYSWGLLGVQRVVVQSLEEIAYGTLRMQHSFSSQRFSIIVKGVEERELIRPIMTFQASGEMPGFTLTADTAVLSSDLERNALILELVNCEIETGRGVQGSFPGKIRREIPLDYFSPHDDSRQHPKYLPLRKISGEIVEQRRVIRELEQTHAAEAAWQLMTGDYAELNDAAWEQRRRGLENAKERLSRLQTEPYRRTAGGFSCLAFVVIGAPFAIWQKTSDNMSTFFKCFLPILLLYYPLTYLGLNYAKGGVLPPWSMWAGNVLLFGVGYWLMERVKRY